MRWPILRALSILATIAAALLTVWTISRGSALTVAQTTVTTQDKAAAFDVSTLEAVPFEALPPGQIAERPVFSATRKPFVPPPPPAPPPPPPPPPVPVPAIVEVPEPPLVVEGPPEIPEPANIVEAPVIEPPPPQEPQLDPSILQLKGVMTVGGLAQALIVAPESPSGRWVRKGEIIEGWTLTKIDRYSAELKAKNQTTTLELYFEKKPPAVDVTQPGG
jgi:hypothetical protein